MTRRLSFGGIFWSLMLIALGTLLLARNLGYQIPIWQGIATYWPVLLVVWGGIKIVDFVQLRRRGETGRLFSPGEVVFLIFIILTGTAVSAATRWNPGFTALFEMADIDLVQITGTEFSYTEHYEAEVAPGSQIEVINRYGNVDVLPAEGNQIVVDVRKTVIANTREDADELSDILLFSIREEGPGYRIYSSFNRDENSVRGRRFRTSLTVRVPSASSVSVDNRNGDVTIRDLVGDQAVDNAFGAIAIQAVQGNVGVDNRNGEVTVERVNGSVAIDNAFARTSVSEVTGDLTLETRNGDVGIADVAGNASVENSFAAVRASDISGDLTFRGRNSQISIENVGGDADVETTFQGVRVRNVTGELRVANQNGDVNVMFLEPPTQDLFVSTEFSSVTLESPADSAFNLDLFTRLGEIESDFGPEVVRDGRERSLVATVGNNGPSVRIRTRNGNIRIDRN